MAREVAAEGGRRVRTARLEAFSDGVFAIAITLLVLDLTVPDAAGDGLLPAIAEEWPVYLAYVISFATIGAVWVAHTVITDSLAGASPALLRLNLLLLLAVGFLPYPTRLLAEYVGDEDAARTAITLYGVAVLLTAVLVSGVWWTARREGLVADDVPEDVRATLTRRLSPGIVGYLVMIGLGLLLPWVAMVGYLLIAVLLLVPPHLFRRP